MFSKRFIMRLCCLALALLSTMSIANGAVNLTKASAESRLVPIYRVEGRQGVVGLSFDAAWGADKTQSILDILDQYNVKCTFFLVTFWVEKYPELTAEIVKRGHEVGTHSSTHPDMTKLSAEQIRQELSLSCASIFEVTQVQPTLFRPPFGAYNNLLLNTASQMGLTTIQWDVDSLDWKGISAKDIAMRVAKSESGSIILCHNNSDHIVQALPLMLEMLKSKGLTAIPIGQLIYTKDYTIDHTGAQRQNG